MILFVYRKTSKSKKGISKTNLNTKPVNQKWTQDNLARLNRITTLVIILCYTKKIYLKLMYRKS